MDSLARNQIRIAASFIMARKFDACFSKRGCDAPEVLDLVEKALDVITLSVQSFGESWTMLFG